MRNQQQVVQELYKADILIKNSVATLLKKDIIIIVNHRIVLRENPVTQELRNINAYIKTELPETMEYLNGKFLKFKDKIIPLASTKTRNLLVKFSEEQSYSDSQILRGLSNYYERIPTMYMVDNQFIYKNAKGVKALTEDLIVFQTLAYNKPEYFNKWG